MADLNLSADDRAALLDLAQALGAMDRRYAAGSAHARPSLSTLLSELAARTREFGTDFVMGQPLTQLLRSSMSIAADIVAERLKVGEHPILNYEFSNDMARNLAWRAIAHVMRQVIDSYQFPSQDAAKQAQLWIDGLRAELSDRGIWIDQQIMDAIIRKEFGVNGTEAIAAAKRSIHNA